VKGNNSLLAQQELLSIFCTGPALEPVAVRVGPEKPHLLR
jgi:hypothetical protein